MKKYLIVLIFCLITVNSFAQSSSKRLSEFNLDNKVALHGYDPVAYFTVNKALKGKKSYAVSYQNVIYYFSSQSNKDAFLKNPSNYEPQYGGWCAYAMGNSGEKVDIDPVTFKIVDGKLYVFYNAFFNNTLKSWNKNEAYLMKKADENWKKIME